MPAIDNVKIDKSFIDEVLESASGKGIVMAIIAMTRELNLSVTAEGVEVVEQRDFLMHPRAFAP